MTIPFILSGLSLCVSVLSFFFFRWYIKRKTAATQLLADYRDEVGRLIAEIDTATDRDSLLVEERIKILRKMLEDTDRRIATYVRELQRSRDGEAMYTSLGRGIRSALDSRPTPKGAELLQPQEAASLPPQEEAEPIVEVVHLSETNETTETTVESDDRHDDEVRQEPLTLPFEKSRIKVRIAEMSARGIPTQEIASKLGISIAEVDLALSLLNRSTG
ncbi:MAG: hypothetical protein FWB78_05105 [Treponema sp.]|nr:hypothetical protein [Treponema sp.]